MRSPALLRTPCQFHQKNRICPDLCYFKPYFLPKIAYSPVSYAHGGAGYMRSPALLRTPCEWTSRGRCELTGTGQPSGQTRRGDGFEACRVHAVSHAGWDLLRRAYPHLAFLRRAYPFSKAALRRRIHAVNLDAW